MPNSHSQPPESMGPGHSILAGGSGTLLEMIQRLAGSPEEAARLHARLERIAQTILSANTRMNLTADTQPRLFWKRHIEDTLWAALRIEEARGKPGDHTRILDVGSGSGIPGLVWAAVWPRARVDLLESRRGRFEFLREAIAGLALEGAHVFEGRAENFGHRAGHREQYDLVTARALAALPTLLELTMSFAKVGGVVAAIKSAGIGEETRMARAVLALLGGGEESMSLLPYTRSDGKACAVCIIRKTAETPDLYPRRPNLPARQPLLARNR